MGVRIYKISEYEHAAEIRQFDALSRILGELEAQKLLGHSDITTTRRIYTHIRERQLENAAAQIENYIQTTSK